MGEVVISKKNDGGYFNVYFENDRHNVKHFYY